MNQAPENPLLFFREKILEMKRPEFAESIDVSVQYVQMMEKGNREVSREVVRKIVDAYPQTTSDMFLKPDMPALLRLYAEQKGEAGAVKKQAGEISIEQLDVQAGAGNGRTLVEGHRVIDRWVFPLRVLATYNADPRDLKIIQVYGDSMEPELRHGDLVMVNLADRNVSFAGIFVLSCGDDILIKRCMMLPGNDPPRLRIMSTNPIYPPFDLAETECTIHGRVIWKGQWT